MNQKNNTNVATNGGHIPAAEKVMEEVDHAIQATNATWKTGKAEDIITLLIHDQVNIRRNLPGFNTEHHQNKLTNTNIWHIRRLFNGKVNRDYGDDIGKAPITAIEDQLGKYATQFETGYTIMGTTSPLSPKQQPVRETPDGTKNKEEVTSTATPETEKPIPDHKQHPSLPESVETFEVVEVSLKPKLAMPKQDPENNEMTPEERDRFTVLNETVVKSFKGIIAAAMALLEIKKNKLYREKYATFEEYLQEEHSMSKTYAYNIMKSGKTAMEMFSIEGKYPALQVPTKESHFRELSKLNNPEKCYELLTEVIEEKGTEYTAADLAMKVKSTLDITNDSMAPKQPPPKQLFDRLKKELRPLIKRLSGYELDDACQQHIEAIKRVVAQ